MSLSCQLQFNPSGAWRTVLDFDLKGLPSEFYTHAHFMLCLAGGEKIKARIVKAEPGANGRMVGTHQVVMRWDREKSWVKA